MIVAAMAKLKLRQVIKLGDDDPRHGTANGYRKLKCRCPKCKKAHAACAYEARKKRPPLAPNDPRHGTEYGYTNWKCRCVRCAQAHTDAKRSYVRRCREKRDVM